MHASRHDVLKGLNSIEGNLGDVRKLIEGDTYCVDILRQTYKARKAIETLEKLILDGHLQGCVPEGMKRGNEEAVIQELLQLYGLVGNR